jgi:hypothetical protein
MGNVQSHQDSIILTISAGLSQEPQYARGVQGTVESFSLGDNNSTEIFDRWPLGVANITTNTNPSLKRHEPEGSPDVLDTRQKQAKLTHEEQLCQECLKIDVANIFKEADEHFSKFADNVKRMPRTESSKAGLYIKSFNGSLSQRSTCPVCRFFWSMRIGQDDSGSYELRAFSSITCSGFINSNYFNGQEIMKAQNAFLAVVPAFTPLEKPYLAFGKQGSIFRTITSGAANNMKVNGVWGREIQQRINFADVQEWLQFCCMYHRGGCTQGRHSGKTILQGFRLINCKTNPPKVEAAPSNKKYVALSYVWGPDSNSLSWPRVVLDAIQVTTELGFDYLWVDRYCIDQDNPEEKNYLISKMAWIYEGAEITIIAASGNNANYGLPGVGRTTRLAQPKIKVAGMTLVSTLCDPRVRIRESVWWTRGWTYQEGVLSRRRLVFTADQVYWECGGMVAHEAIHLPLRLLHTKNALRMSPYMQVGVFSGKPEEFSSFQTKGLDDKRRGAEIAEHVTNFTRRNLTFDTDSLFAFEGISDRYSDSKSGIRFIRGLPVLVRRGPQHCRSSFALSLASWIHLESGKENKRRLRFPSWTWAGWKGSVAWGWPYNTYIPQMLFYRWHLDLLLARDEVGDIFAPEIFLTSKDGRAMSLSEDPFPLAVTGNISHVLRIKQPFVFGKCNLVRLSGDPEETPTWNFNNFEARIGLSIGESSSDTQSLLNDESVKVILLSWIIAQKWSSRFLIIRRAKYNGGEEYWERVGVMILDVGTGVERGHVFDIGQLKGALDLQQLKYDVLLI